MKTRVLKRKTVKVPKPIRIQVLFGLDDTPEYAEKIEKLLKKIGNLEAERVE
jgi:hypothetical protein